MHAHTYDPAVANVDTAIAFARQDGESCRTVLQFADGALTGAQADSMAGLMSRARALGAVRLYLERVDGEREYDPAWRGVALL